VGLDTPQSGSRHCWPRVQILKTLFCTTQHIPPNPNCFELFGFDLLLDEVSFLPLTMTQRRAGNPTTQPPTSRAQNLKTWLIEVNASPALVSDHPSRRLITRTNDLSRLVFAGSGQRTGSNRQERSHRGHSPSRQSSAIRSEQTNGTCGVGMSLCVLMMCTAPATPKRLPSTSTATTSDVADSGQRLVRSSACVYMHVCDCSSAARSYPSSMRVSSCSETCSTASKILFQHGGGGVFFLLERALMCVRVCVRVCAGKRGVGEFWRTAVRVSERERASDRERVCVCVCVYVCLCPLSHSQEGLLWGTGSTSTEGCTTCMTSRRHPTLHRRRWSAMTRKKTLAAHPLCRVYTDRHCSRASQLLEDDWQWSGSRVIS